MQIIEKTPNSIKAFAITLPVITIVTSLLIFNLDAEMVAFDSLVRKVTFGLQRRMKLHFRKDWKDRALALYLDHLITEPPARKAAKQSSNWVYILFLVETIVVGLPVSEVNAALDFYGLFRPKNETDWDDDNSGLPDVDTEFRNKMRKEVRRRVKQAAQQAKEREQNRQEKEKGVFRALINRSLKSAVRLARLLVLIFFNFLRVLLLPVWMILLALQYALVVAYLVLVKGPPSGMESLSQGRKTSSGSENASPFVKAWRILGLDTITFPKRHGNGNSSRSSDEFAPESLPNRSSGSKAPGKESAVPENETKQIASPDDSEQPSPLSTNDRDRGRYGANVELSTFAAEPRTATVRRISRATNYARHGRGFIPGDIAAESQR